MSPWCWLCPWQQLARNAITKCLVWNFRRLFSVAASTLVEWIEMKWKQLSRKRKCAVKTPEFPTLTAWQARSLLPLLAALQHLEIGTQQEAPTCNMPHPAYLYTPSPTTLYTYRFIDFNCIAILTNIHLEFVPLCLAADCGYPILCARRVPQTYTHTQTKLISSGKREPYIVADLSQHFCTLGNMIYFNSWANWARSSSF